MLLLLILAALVIVILSAVAAYLHWLLYKKRKLREQGLQQLKAQQLETRMRNLDSIEILLRALMQQQLSLTEASIRVSVLAESLGLGELQAKDFSAFRQLASACSHIPILDRWKALSSKQKREFEAVRQRQEKIYEPFVLDAAKNFLEIKETYVKHIQS